MTDVTIRMLDTDERREAVALSLEVFVRCGAADFDEEGLETFKSFVFNDRLMEELTLYGAFDKKNLVGVLGTKNGGKHISLFFISPAYHRKNIGRRLFVQALKEENKGEWTVNSSSYAVPFYQKMGFEVVGEAQVYHGLKSIPMRRRGECRIAE